MTQTKVGQKVWYYPVRGEKERRPSVVLSEPWALGHGAMVVRIEGQTGGVSPLHLEPRGDEEKP